MNENVSTSTKRKRAGRPPGKRRGANLPNYRVMQWFDEQRNAQSLSKIGLAKKLGYSSASRITQYFSQRIVAGPQIIREFALALGVSPIEALWRAEHYGEVLNYLSLLYELGWLQMKADKVGFNSSFGSDFVSPYIEEFEGQLPPDLLLDRVPQNLTSRYHHTVIYNEAGEYVRISLAKPIACAILLAVGFFPRRGERLRESAPDFVGKLSILASDLLPGARRASGRFPAELRSSLAKPLKDAQEHLHERFYGSMRLALLAEFVHSWCDLTNKAYAEYARLALYERGAFIRDPTENEDIWAWQWTEMPSINDLK